MSAGAGRGGAWRGEGVGAQSDSTLKEKQSKAGKRGVHVWLCVHVCTFVCMQVHACACVSVWVCTCVAAGGWLMKAWEQHGL